MDCMSFFRGGLYPLNRFTWSTRCLATFLKATNKGACQRRVSVYVKAARKVCVINVVVLQCTGFGGSPLDLCESCDDDSVMLVL